MTDKPNILVIMTDQQKATASHLYGNTFCETPSMERLAREGVLFEYAFTPHPLCVPARVSLWTSQFPHSHGGRRNQTLMPADAPHTFKIWKEADYRTGLVGKNHCFDLPEDMALFDMWCYMGRGNPSRDESPLETEWFQGLNRVQSARQSLRDIPQQSPRFNYRVSHAPVEDHSTALIADQTVRFLEEYRNEPFVLWISFPDPHEPWIAPEKYASMFPREKIQLPPWREGEFDERAPERNRVLHQILGMEDDPLEHVYGVMGIYYAMVRFLDDRLGQILDALEALDLRRNTIVVFCADHGDFMGEHRMSCKGGVFYDCLTRVPLIVSCPGQIPSGERDSSMVNLIDIAPTLLQLQGLDIPRSMHGECLPTVTDAEPRDATFSEYGTGGPPFCMSDLEKLPQPYGRRALMQSLHWREAEGRRKMVRTRKWKYVHDPMGDRDELYDMENDPWELENVVDDRSNQAALAEMQLRLADWSIKTEDARPVPLPEQG
ncbi:sulfatase-like hydrolase/transferase [Candidatus Poribacteria bacterium]